ncbi:MAG: hypothetical protein OHK0046_11560 [Anaerolineae bacterium]
MHCLIANRGEIAVRIIRACDELGYATTALYTEPDAHALHTTLADHAFPINSYLNAPEIIRIAQQAGCDAIHPGYGFLSENADFAAQVIDAGITWVGPLPETIRQMGVKTEARALMQAAGVPVVPGFQSESTENAAFIAAAAEIGYPVMVKAAGGGGGKGIRIVREAAALPDALDSARREAEKAFQDRRVFLEKYIEAGRHIEVQIIADAHGHVLHLFERECSVQRRHQKIIEETPSPLLTTETRQAITRAAVDAARAVNYINAGTVEFIATQQGEFYFLEMNTRLQVEHPVTELVTGLDLVKLQFRVAAGEALPFAQSEVAQRGHAIECRVYAEDPHNHFLPAVGRVLRFTSPQRPGVRVDTGLQSGDEITIHYDPMIAKVIVHAPTRAEAIARMQQALHETVILGTTTNIDFLQVVLAHPDFITGQMHTATIDTHLAEMLPESALPEAILQAALIALAVQEAHGQAGPVAAPAEDGTDRFSPWNRTDRFRLQRR